MKLQDRDFQSKNRGSLFFAQNSLHLHSKEKSFFAQNKKAEKEFFDRFDKEGGYDVLEESGYEKFIDFMKSKINPNKKLVILDMGCGSGVFTSFVKKAYKNSRVVGIDISKGCIERARKEYPRIEFMVDDVERTKFKSSSVDVIWYSGILHHFPDFSKVAKEAFRLLKPRGLFFSYDPNFYNPAFWLYRHPKSPFYSKIGITSNERLLKSSEIENVFNNAGFSTNVKAISGVKFRYVESKKTRPLLSIYNLWDKMLALTPLSSVIGAFLVGYGIKKRSFVPQKKSFVPQKKSFVSQKKSFVSQKKSFVSQKKSFVSQNGKER